MRARHAASDLQTARMRTGEREEWSKVEAFIVTKRRLCGHLKAGTILITLQ